jgi:sortase A
LLLRLGIASVILAFSLAVVVAMVLNRSGEAEKPIAQPVAAVESEPVEEPAEDDGFDPGTYLELDEEPAPEPQPAEEPQPEPRPQEDEEPQPQPEPQPEEVAPIPPEEQRRPSASELEAASKPRRYASRPDSALALTIPRMQVYNAPVLNSLSSQALMNGVVHVPQSSMPWDDTQHKNVYLAGHRVGYGGTASNMIFYNLDKLRKGDLVSLKDRRGKAYDYRVSEIFVVRPTDGWVADAVRDRDMLTLQTCTYPTFENRLIVRADRV